MILSRNTILIIVGIGFMLKSKVKRLNATFFSIPIAHFHAGLRLPIDPFLVDVFDVACSHLVCFHPNAICYMTCFFALCRRLGTKTSVPLFLHYFDLVRSPEGIILV